MDPNLFIAATGVLLTIFAAIWSLAWWLSGQFSQIRDLIHTRVENVMHEFQDKLEYHEKHDDSRFDKVTSVLNNINNQIWEMRVFNASKLKETPK